MVFAFLETFILFEEKKKKKKKKKNNNNNNYIYKKKKKKKQRKKNPDLLFDDNICSQWRLILSFYGRLLAGRQNIFTASPPLTLKASALSSACDFESHFCKQCGPRSDCSFRSSLIWVHTVCRYTKNSFEKFARIFSRRHKQTTFSDAVFLGALRVKCVSIPHKKVIFTSFPADTQH